jgi:hypothetical protein
MSLLDGKLNGHSDLTPPGNKLLHILLRNKAVFFGQRQGLEINRSLGNLSAVKFPFLLSWMISVPGTDFQMQFRNLTFYRTRLR